jgi:hypothetical protein
MYYILSVTYLEVPIHFPRVAMELKRQRIKLWYVITITFEANISHHSGNIATAN